MFSLFIDKIVLTTGLDFPFGVTFKGKSKEAFGSSDALSPKYFEYKSNAGKLSISNKTLPSDFVIILSGPKGLHPPKLANEISKESP